MYRYIIEKQLKQAEEHLKKYKEASIAAGIEEQKASVLILQILKEVFRELIHLYPSIEKTTLASAFFAMPYE